MLNLRGPEEQVIQAVITEVQEESVTIDANHPLAGEDLTFDIELAEIVWSTERSPTVRPVQRAQKRIAKVFSPIGQ